MLASSLPVLSALKHRENLLLNPNAHGGLSSARLTATPNGCRYYRWTRGNAMQFLQVVYNFLTKYRLPLFSEVRAIPVS